MDIQHYMVTGADGSEIMVEVEKVNKEKTTERCKLYVKKLADLLSKK